ncbi:MAG: HDOD domain-containing protein [Armatimonadetes bacterium]|nr:HDOD domain-containing protein [Armatimonadota bacterium]
MSDTLGGAVLGSAEFDALLGKFRSAETLPDLPASALQLCDAIDKGDASTADLEKIILSDPAVTAGILKAANSALYGGRTNQASTVKGAVMLLGQRTVRSIAVSVWVQSLVHQSKGSPRFNAGKFASHSMFVGFMSRYLLSAAQANRGVRSGWSPEELFAAGVLHDLGLGLLASIDARLYDRVTAHASANGKTFSEAFHDVTERTIDTLGVAAAQAWMLPDLFVEVLLNYNDPLNADREVDALCCVCYAEHLAMTTGHSLFDWRVEPTIDPTIVERVGLPAEELPEVLQLVADHAKEFTKAA